MKSWSNRRSSPNILRNFSFFSFNHFFLLWFLLCALSSSVFFRCCCCYYLLLFPLSIAIFDFFFHLFSFLSTFFHFLTRVVAFLDEFLRFFFIIIIILFSLINTHTHIISVDSFVVFHFSFFFVVLFRNLDLVEFKKSKWKEGQIDC